MNELDVGMIIIFTIKINDTHEGFVVECTDSRTNVITQLHTTTSWNIAYQIFLSAIHRVGQKWFKLKSAKFCRNNTIATFEPIKQFDLRKEK